MARNKMAKKITDEAAGKITFEFSDGRTLSIAVSELTPEMATRAAMHGLSQKGGDSYAGAESVDEAYDACESTLAALRGPNGTWSTRTVGEGGARGTMLVEALYRATKHEGKTMDDCEQLVADMSDEQKKGIRNIPAIKAQLDAIAAERAMERAEKSAKSAADKPLDLSAFVS